MANRYVPTLALWVLDEAGKAATLEKVALRLQRQWHVDQTATKAQSEKAQDHFAGVAAAGKPRQSPSKAPDRGSPRKSTKPISCWTCREVFYDGAAFRQHKRQCQEALKASGKTCDTCGGFHLTERHKRATKGTGGSKSRNKAGQQTSNADGNAAVRAPSGTPTPSIEDLTVMGFIQGGICGVAVESNYGNALLANSDGGPYATRVLLDSAAHAFLAGFLPYFFDVRPIPKHLQFGTIAATGGKAVATQVGSLRLRFRTARGKPFPITVTNVRIIPTWPADRVLLSSKTFVRRFTKGASPAEFKLTWDHDGDRILISSPEDASGHRQVVDYITDPDRNVTQLDYEAIEDASGAVLWELPTSVNTAGSAASVEPSHDAFVADEAEFKAVVREAAAFEAARAQADARVSTRISSHLDANAADASETTVSLVQPASNEATAAANAVDRALAQAAAHAALRDLSAANSEDGGDQDTDAPPSGQGDSLVASGQIPSALWEARMGYPGEAACKMTARHTRGPAVVGKFRARRSAAAILGRAVSAARNHGLAQPSGTRRNHRSLHFEELALDLHGPIAPSLWSHRKFLSCTTSTGLVAAFPLQHATADDVIGVLQRFITKCGKPKHIKVDRDPAFMRSTPGSRFKFQRFLDAQGISLKVSAPHEHW